MLLSMTLSTMEPNQSVCILFWPKGFRSPVADLLLAGNRLLYVNLHRYLGVMIEVGKCELDIKRQLMQFYANANTLIRVFGKCSNDVKIKLFHTYCTTLYCGIFWYEATVRESRRLRVSYNNSLRKLFNLPYDCSASGMCVSRGIPSYHENICKCT